MTSGRTIHRESRVAGFLYVAVIMLGAFAEAFVRQRLFVHGDSAATLAAVAAHETQWRLALLADLAMLMCNIVIVAIFYRLFRVVHHLGASLIVFFTLVQVAMQAAILMLHAVPLLLLDSGPALAALALSERAALAYLSLRLLATGYNMVLMVFGLVCISLGFVVVQSGFVPRWLGALMALAGLSYILNGLFAWLAPTVAPTWLLLLCLVGEVSMALWLALFGVDEQRWDAHARFVDPPLAKGITDA